MQKTTQRKIGVFIIAIAIPLFVGVLSALLTRGNMDIYSEINKPPLAPPAFLFPIVWTLLYVLMGVSSAMVYLSGEDGEGLRFYALSLAVNFFFSIIFFNFGAFLIAFLWTLLLLYLVIRTVISYFKTSRIAAYLQIPYVLWVAFAGYLTFAIFLLNG